MMPRYLLSFSLGVLMLANQSGFAAPSSFAAALDAQWDYAKPEVSERRFRDELARWERDTPQAVEVETQLARALGLLRRFDDAAAILASVEQRLDGMPSHVRVRYLLEHGRLLNSSGKPERAVPLFTIALELASCADDGFYAIDAAHMLGIAAPPDERLDWNLKALAMAERTTDTRSKRWLSSLYNNIGWTFDERGETAQALAYFRKALPAWEARGGDDDIRVARWTLAHGLRRTGELDDAERMQRALLAEHERNGTGDGYVSEELAEIAYARGKASDARPWFAKAYAALKEDATTEPARLKRLAELGGVVPVGVGAPAPR